MLGKARCVLNQITLHRHYADDPMKRSKKTLAQEHFTGKFNASEKRVNGEHRE